MKKFVFVLLLAVLMVPLAHSQTKGLASGMAISSTGRPMGGATVTVCTDTDGIHCTSLATLYANQNGASCTLPCSNPSVGDIFGNWHFFADYGFYTVQLKFGAAVQTFLVQVSATSGGGGSPHNLLSTTHPDTVPYSPPVFGDLVQGNGTSQWQRLQGNTNAIPKWLKSIGNGSQTVFQNWVQVGNSCLPGQFANVLNPDLTISCGPPPSGNSLVLPPPFAIPNGQGVAFAFPTTAVAGNTDGGVQTNGYAIAGIANGIVNMTHSCGLCNFGWTNTWGGFVMPSLPGDAVIQGVYGVQIATRVGSGTAVWNSNCSSQGFSNDNTSSNFSGEFSTSTLGSTVGTVTGASCTSKLTQSLVATFNDTATTNAIALAIYYTSATPFPQSGFYFPLPGSGGGGGGSVTNVTSGSLSPLFNVTVTNSSTTPNLAFAAIAVSPHFYYGNGSGISAIPDFHALAVGDLPYTYSGNTSKLVTMVGTIGNGNCFIGDASGNAIDGGTCGLVPANPSAWDSGTTYSKNTVVLYNGASYYSLVTTLGVTPGSDSTKWALLAAAGLNGSAGTNGANGAPGVPGYSPNQVSAGCGVVWNTGLTFNISACSYLIQNNPYSTAQTSLTLAAADPTFDRIDLIAVNSSGAVVGITGTAAASPAPPSVDISSQLQLTFVYIPAGSSTPNNITVTDIYHENTEWTCSVSANLNCASTTNPHSGTKDIEATTATTGNFARLTIPASTIDISGKNFVFWIRSKATWPATRSLVLQWFNGTTAKCSPVSLASGNFTFNSSNTSAYQQIVIPTSAFGCAGVPLTRIQFLVAGTGGTIGFYLDDVILQAGVTSSTSTPGLNPRGVWSSTTAYSVNDFVFSGSTSYYALLANINSTPSLVNANWQVVSSASGTVTSVATTAPLSGGTITSTGTLSLAANGVTSAFSAVVNNRRSCSLQVGDGTNTVLSSDYSPFKVASCKIPYAAHIVEIDVQSDAGTPSVLLQRRRGAATLADLLSGALAGAGTTPTCSTAVISTACIDGTTSSGTITLSNAALNAGDVVEMKSGTASTETSTRVTITWTVD